MSRNCYFKVQLANGNTVSVPCDQFLDMTDKQLDDFYSKPYGKYVSDVFASSSYNNETSYDEKMNDVDMEINDD